MRFMFGHGGHTFIQAPERSSSVYLSATTANYKLTFIKKRN